MKLYVRDIDLVYGPRTCKHRQKKAKGNKRPRENINEGMNLIAAMDRMDLVCPFHKGWGVVAELHTPLVDRS